MTVEELKDRMLGEELMAWIAYFEIVREAEEKAMDEAKKDAETKAASSGRRAPGRDARTMGSHNGRPAPAAPGRRDNRVPLK